MFPVLWTFVRQMGYIRQEKNWAFTPADTRATWSLVNRERVARWIECTCPFDLDLFEAIRTQGGLLRQV